MAVAVVTASVVVRMLRWSIRDLREDREADRAQIEVLRADLAVCREEARAALDDAHECRAQREVDARRIAALETECTVLRHRLAALDDRTRRDEEGSS